MLRIRYLFREAIHEVTVGDEEPVKIPKQCKYFSLTLRSVSIKAGFHMIADDRGSQIADRRKFCDRLRSYGNTLLRSPAILRS